MPRRAHRKSRKGCIECKRRHVKCDEKRPICSNCTSSERSCQYAVIGDVEIVQYDHPRKTTSPPVSNSSFASPTPTPAPPSCGSSHPNADEQQEKCPPVNMEHVELFYHLSTQTIESFLPDFEGVHIPYSEMMKELVAAPYLMNELLALAAIHLSVLRPENQDLHRRQATELQTHALSIFNRMRPEITADTCVPMFVFSSILGLHVMCETFVYRESTFELFLERFIRYITLHQGVRAVTHGTWHLLRESYLKPLLQKGESLSSSTPSPGPLCSKLLTLINSTDLPQEVKSCYEQAISALQSVLSAAHSDPRGIPNINAILMWPLIQSPRYTDLLREREPHALVLLGHYAALVNSRRDMWMCGDGGRVLVEFVTGFLGPAWEEWMGWPGQAVVDPVGAIAVA